MLIVTPTLQIPDSELQWSFARSGGPGGQNVNKVASKAVLRWHIASSPSVAGDVKERFIKRNESRLTSEGWIVVMSERTRSQRLNRQDCLDILARLLREAVKVPRRRRPTRPTRGSKERRLETKKHRAATKAQRRSGAES
jgi:ribosome-associated protein